MPANPYTAPLMQGRPGTPGTPGTSGTPTASAYSLLTPAAQKLLAFIENQPMRRGMTVFSLSFATAVLSRNSAGGGGLTSDSGGWGREQVGEALEELERKHALRYETVVHGNNPHRGTWVVCAPGFAPIDRADALRLVERAAVEAASSRPARAA